MGAIKGFQQLIYKIQSLSKKHSLKKALLFWFLVEKRQTRLMESQLHQ